MHQKTKYELPSHDCYGRRAATGTKIASVALATTLAVFSVAAVQGDPELDADARAASPAIIRANGHTHEGLIHGRVTTTDGSIYEGRLRWGDEEEALWGNYFNGFKDDNPWVAYAPPERLPTERLSIDLFGIELASWERKTDLGRPFMARFGDIVRIEPRGRDIQVTLKSGAVFDLDRFAADDLADGVRVWDNTHGTVDIGESRIRSIELVAPAHPGADSDPYPDPDPGPDPLHGTVHTTQGDFNGLVQWDREKAVGADELEGNTPDGARSLRFDTITSIARHSHDSARVTTLDGRDIVLGNTRDGGNRGIYVDDRRYGRVLISWDTFERIVFSPGDTGPAYDDYPPGRPLKGDVITRSGRRFSGRLVYDLDESETTETLDAPSLGVDYTIPFGLIGSIVLPELRGTQNSTVTLLSGEALQLEPAGDLGAGNAGMLIFMADGQHPEYVTWTDVRQVIFDPAP